MKFPLPRLREAVRYVAAWVPLFLLYAVMLRRSEAAATAGQAALYASNYLAPAIVVGATIWQLARRVPWRRLNGWQFAGVELVLGLAYTVVWQGLFLAWLALMDRDAARANTTMLLGWPLLMVLLIVAMHSVVFHMARTFAALRKKEVAAAQSEAARVRAEMLVLRGQLDPHFLFNSLHTITALVREDPVRAEEALLQFGALLRRVLAVKRDSADEVTVATELKFVEDYLAIERLRLGERLRVKWEIAAEARECRVPAFSVQPLVENAIHHAIAPRRDGGTLTVRARVRAGRLEVLVHDDGPGADPAAVAGATGVGLQVIRQRLHLRHGPAAALAVDTAPGRGFGVTLSLPASHEEVVA